MCLNLLKKILYLFTNYFRLFVSRETRLKIRLVISDEIFNFVWI